MTDRATSSQPLVSLARFSTSTKILIILTLALLPLGLIASLASLETARTNRANRMLAAHLLAGDSADRMTLFLDRGVAALKSAHRLGAGGCRRAVDELGASNDGASRVALFDADGRLVCASRHLAATLPLGPLGSAPLVTLDPTGQVVRMIVSTGEGWALAELPSTLLAQASHPNALDGSYQLLLRDTAGRAVMLAVMRTVALGHDIVTTLPVAGGQLSLRMTTEAAPLSANEVLLLMLPLLMWAAAAAIGWLVVDRLIIRPLEDLQRAIDLYRMRGGRLVLPVMTTPAHEIRVLGEALSAATSTISRHESELEDGLARQTKLTREVHHRVKNNLQVVASLLNIHARSAKSPEAIAAYGAIQRRVDALALVHRSHFAELEVNRGLALRPLIGELAANLRGSLPAGMPAPRIQVEVALHCATQDVAVPIAFLVTELLELSMFRQPGAAIAITLAPNGGGDRATLAIRSNALRRDVAPIDETYERCTRVVGGLARQLRSALRIDETTGTFALDISVMATESSDEPPSPDGIIQEHGASLQAKSAS